MELWEINMNHVSKIVIFFHIYTCIYEYLIIIIDIYFIEDKKNRKCYWRCTNVQCIICSLNDCPLLSREYLGSRKKKERFSLCTILLEIICIDWAISMKLNVLECTSNCECFLLCNFKYSTWRISFNSYTVVLCTKSIAALCCHTALKLGVNEVVKIDCIFSCIVGFSI